LTIGGGVLEVVTDVSPDSICKDEWKAYKQLCKVNKAGKWICGIGFFMMLFINLIFYCYNFIML